LKTTSWKDLAELVGIAAIVASLIFVGLELQQSRAVALAEVHQSRAQIGMQFSAWPRDPSVEQLGLLPQEIWDANIRAMAAWIPFDENFDDYWLRKRHEWNVSFAPVIDEYVEVSQSRGDR